MTTSRYLVEFHEISNPQLIESVGGNVRFNYANIPNLLSAELTLEQANQLFDYAEVKDVRVVRQGIYAAGVFDWGYISTKTDTFYKGVFTGNGVKVAIVDSGVAYHENLPSVVEWKDFINDRTTQYDDLYHGTHIAGIIAAQNNNVVIGIAPDVELYACKVLDSSNRGYIDDFIMGIDWSISQGVDIINLSLVSEYYDQTLVDATRRAYSAGIIVVSCSGNGTFSMDKGWDGDGISTVYCPAVDYSCVAVGSIDVNERRSSFSNYGDGLNCVAPGSSTYSTSNTGGFRFGSGTSYATAYVTGHLAVLKEIYPGYSRSLLLNRLYSNCKNLGSNYEYGYGLVQAEKTKPVELIQDLVNTTINTIYFSWEPIDIAEKYHIYKDGVYQHTVVAPVLSSSLSFSPYTHEYHDIAISPWSSKFGEFGYAKYVRMYARPRAPILNSSSTIIQSNKVKLVWDYASSIWHNYWVMWKYYGEPDTAFRHVGTLNNVNYYWWENLQPNTTYVLRVKRFVITPAGDLGSVGLDVTVTTANNRPENWVWHVNIAPGQPLTNLTWSEWNAFLARINQFEDYKWGSHTDFSGYKPLYSGQVFTAAMFNKAREATGSMVATGITTKYAGDPVLASYFETLKNRLNQV